MAAKSKQVFIIGGAAIIIAAIASVSLYNYLRGQEARMKESVATQSVVVADKEIAINTAINDTQIKTVNWPKANVPPGSFTSPAQVIGRLTQSSLASGEPIIESKLVPVGGQAGILSYRIPEGHRAMTVAVDQVTGVAGFITPGNKVDVVVVVQPAGAKQPLSKIVLQDIPVLAVGQVVSEQQKEGKPQLVPTVTMDVTPGDAEKLGVASTQGKLQLVLRRAGDVEQVKTAGATIVKVLAGSGTTEQKEAPKVRIVRKARPKAERKETAESKQEQPELYKVTIYRGSQKPVVETFTREKQ